MASPVAQPELGDDRPEEHGVQGLAMYRPHLPERIQQNDSACGKRQRQRRIEHGEPAGPESRLRQEVEVVGDGLHAGVGAAAEGIGAHEQRDDEHPPQGGSRVAGLLHRVRHERRQPVGLADDTVTDERAMGQEEAEHDRSQQLDRLSHAPQVEQEQEQHQADFHGQLVSLGTDRQQTEQRVRAAGDGDGDGEHVIHQQRGTG